MSKEVIENGRKYVLAYSSDPKKRKRVLKPTKKECPQNAIGSPQSTQTMLKVSEYQNEVKVFKSNKWN